MTPPELYRPRFVGEDLTDSTNYIDVIAAERIVVSRFCAIDSNGEAVYATRDGKKAAGISVTEAETGEAIRLQVFGLYNNFLNSYPPQYGDIYYQADFGLVIPNPHADLDVSIPAGILVKPATLLLLTDTQWLDYSGSTPLTPAQAATTKSFVMTGDGAQTIWYINHELSNHWPVVQVYDKDTREIILIHTESIDNENIKIESDSPLALNSEYIVTIIG